MTIRERRRGSTLAVVLVMVAAAALAATPPESADEDAGGPGPLGAADMSVTGERLVDDDEEWGDVTVTSTGRLVVMEGATLHAASVYLEAGSRLELSGGALLVEGGPADPRGVVRGTCLELAMGPGSALVVEGMAGSASSGDGSGGHAVLDLYVSNEVRIEGSQVLVQGGEGASPASPGTAGGVAGRAYAGGRASLSIAGLNDWTRLCLLDSSVSVLGGSGGDAPDGRPARGESAGRGGGFTEGGDVSGDVARGGDTSLELEGAKLELTGCQLRVEAGRGGDAGDGSHPASHVDDSDAGGGGGGYTGGMGANVKSLVARPGGDVSGRVGSGGDASARLEGWAVSLTGTVVDVAAGRGGDAGDGGVASFLGGGGGGGGAGYTGGGGGSPPFLDGGDGGEVYDEVGSGGDAAGHLRASDSLSVTGSGVNVTGGRGGDGGDGGMNVGDTLHVAGAGGGGYSGGGGSGFENLDIHEYPGAGGRSGNVSGEVASGGDASLLVESPDLYVGGSTLATRGGEGGGGGVPGHDSIAIQTAEVCGGGGGGCQSGGGGGGPRGGAGGPAGGVFGGVGDGGDARLELGSEEACILADCRIGSEPGPGGDVWLQERASEKQGSSAGRMTAGGRATCFVPVSRPRLVSPVDGHIGEEVPLLRWCPVHDSTFHGPVSGYRVELDDDPGMSSPHLRYRAGSSAMLPLELPSTTTYWRVRALYASPGSVSGPWSDSWGFTYLNAPPSIASIPTQHAKVGADLWLDLGDYVTDPEGDPLVVKCDSYYVKEVDGTRLRIRFHRMEGTKRIDLTVADPLHVVEGHFDVVTITHKHPPVINGLSGIHPPVSLVMEEGELRTYTVEVHDLDSDHFTYSLSGGWDGAEVHQNGTLELHPAKGDVGDRRVTVTVRDETGSSDSLDVEVTVVNVPDPPDTPVVISPVDGSVFDEGELVIFKVRVSDPDVALGEALEVSIVSNVSGLIATAQVTDRMDHSTADLDPGVHLVTVVVTDGRHSASADLELTVKGPPPKADVLPPGEESIFDAWFVLSCIALLVLGYAGGRWRAGRAAAETEA